MRPDLPVMLFTAGFGTRMAPLTDNLPKPLIEVGGKPLVGHALDIVRAAGASHIVANTHYLADIMTAWLEREGVICVYEPEILETGGGLRNALPALGNGPVITLNTDAVWLGVNPVAMLQQAWRPDEMDALLLVVPIENAQGHTGGGDFDLTAEQRLVRGQSHVYSGLQILKTDILAEVTEQKFSLNTVWNLMAAKGRLHGLPYGGQWCDVGRPESIALAETMLERADV